MGVVTASILCSNSSIRYCNDIAQYRRYRYNIDISPITSKACMLFSYYNSGWGVVCY